MMVAFDSAGRFRSSENEVTRSSACEVGSETYL